MSSHRLSTIMSVCQPNNDSGKLSAGDRASCKALYVRLVPTDSVYLPFIFRRLDPSLALGDVLVGFRLLRATSLHIRRHAVALYDVSASTV